MRPYHRFTFATARRLSGWLIVGAFCAWLSVAPAAARSAGPDVQTEYRIKAAYLFNFTKFVSWPPQAFADSAAPLVIGIVSGDAAVAGTIADTLRGKTTAGGRDIDVRVFPTLEAAVPSAQLIFLTRSSGIGADRVRQIVGSRPVLVVGESDGFAERGGTVNFVLSGDAVRFEINPRRAEMAGLKVSGSLASVARLVHDREGD